MQVPQLPDDSWSFDFVSEQLASGRRFASWGSSTIAPGNALADLSLSGRRVARELDLLIARRGKPGPSCDTEQTRMPGLGRANPGGMALHRTGQANAE
jgi:putative transposase